MREKLVGPEITYKCRHLIVSVGLKKFESGHLMRWWGVCKCTYPLHAHPISHKVGVSGRWVGGVCFWDGMAFLTCSKHKVETICRCRLYQHKHFITLFWIHMEIFVYKSFNLVIWSELMELACSCSEQYYLPSMAPHKGSHIDLPPIFHKWQKECLHARVGDF